MMIIVTGLIRITMMMNDGHGDGGDDVDDDEKDNNENNNAINTDQYLTLSNL